MIRIIPKMLQDRFDKIAYDKEQIFLAYAPGLTREIREFAEKHIKGFGFKRISWMQTGCVVSCHGGPGVFGVIGFAAS
jgi:fatty acid-binding protein DegV